MKDKSLKSKTYAKPPRPERVEWLRERLGDDECRIQFVLWSGTYHLDVSGILDEDGSPVFRPAACAWEAWKAAWALRA